MPRKPVTTQSLSGLADNISLASQRREQHDKDYPMCARLSKVRSDKAILMAFLEWLHEDKKAVICQPDQSDIYLDDEQLLMEYFEIDPQELEKERRKILAAQRRANGDLDEED